MIHSGIYYKPDSWKAKNCVDGRRELVAFAKEHGVKHDVCGKVIVATEKEELPRLEPEQRRIAIADRAARAVEALTEKLKPVTSQRLEDHVTNHFRAIADPRFRDGRITFTHDGEPHLLFDGGSKALLSSMSGFERRSFGIAFSLALAEITRRRTPLIFDMRLP